jgi:hypothetical protein
MTCNHRQEQAIAQYDDVTRQLKNAAAAIESSKFQAAKLRANSDGTLSVEAWLVTFSGQRTVGFGEGDTGLEGLPDEASGVMSKHRGNRTNFFAHSGSPHAVPGSQDSSERPRVDGNPSASETHSQRKPAPSPRLRAESNCTRSKRSLLLAALYPLPEASNGSKSSTGWWNVAASSEWRPPLKGLVES